VRQQILNVLQKNDRWTLHLDKPCYFEEQISLLLIRKAMLPAQAELLTNSSNTEWLAWEAGGEYVVVGKKTRVDLANVGAFARAEISLVGLTSKSIDFYGIDTVTT